MTYDEEQALAAVAKEAIKEIRQRRRWKIFFRLLSLALVVLVIWRLSTVSVGETTLGKLKSHLAVVEVHGVISAGSIANAPDMIESLQRAFAQSDAAAVVLDINSPGGSPVQAGQVYRAIRALKKAHDKPVYAIISDAGASGAYYIAAAADEIYADPASIVGSIGVIAQSVGYEELAQKLGLDPRTFIAGEHKDFLSGSRELNPQEVEHMQTLLKELHQQFISAVKRGRGKRLKTRYPDLFSGLFWTGSQSVDIGLTDGLSSLYEFQQEKYPDNDLVVYTPDLTPWAQMMRDMGVEISQHLNRWLGIGEQVNAVQLK